MIYAEVRGRANGGVRLLWVGRLAVAGYWSAMLLLGLRRLAEARWDRQVWAEQMNAWYLEALLFLAMWGVAAGLIALFARSERRRPGRGAYEPGPSTLAALERDRVR